MQSGIGDVNRRQPRRSDKVVVSGAGPIGLRTSEHLADVRDYDGQGAAVLIMSMHQCHIDADRSLGDERANFPRGPGPTTHPRSHPAVNPNSLGQQRHSVNTSDGHTGGRQQPVDSSDENGALYHG